jgi:hypothetical protein
LVTKAAAPVLLSPSPRATKAFCAFVDCLGGKLLMRAEFEAEDFTGKWKAPIWCRPSSKIVSLHPR